MEPNVYHHTTKVLQRSYQHFSSIGTNSPRDFSHNVTPSNASARGPSQQESNTFQPPTAKIIDIPPMSQLEIHSNPASPLTIRLIRSPHGSPHINLEIFGFQLPLDADFTVFPIQDQPLNLWTRTGASVSLTGLVERYSISSNSSLEEAQNVHNMFQSWRVAGLEYLNSHAFRESLQEYQRDHTSNSQSSSGRWIDIESSRLLSFVKKHFLSRECPIPRVLVLGPTASSPFQSSYAKKTLSHTLCGWACRDGFFPLYVELDGSPLSRSPIECLQFPPGVVGVLQLSELAALGYKIHNLEGVSSQERVVSTTLPSLCIESQSKFTPTLGRQCYFLGHVNSEDDDPTLRHWLRTMNCTMTLYITELLYEFLNVATAGNPQLAGTFPNTSQTNQLRLSAGWIINSPPTSTPSFIHELVQQFSVNCVIVVDDSPLYQCLASQYCAEKVPNGHTTALTSDVSVLLLNSMYTIGDRELDVPALNKLGWLDHFFGRIGPEISSLKLKSAAEVIRCQGRPLECPSVRIPLNQMNIVTFVPESNGADDHRKGKELAKTIVNTRQAECVPFDQHPATLLGRVLAIVTSKEIERESIRGAVCVKSISNISNYPEGPHLTIVLELIVSPDDLQISSPLFLKYTTFLLGSDEMMMDIGVLS